MNRDTFCPNCRASLDDRLMIDTWREAYPKMAEYDLLGLVKSYMPSTSTDKAVAKAAKTLRWGYATKLCVDSSTGMSTLCCPDCQHVWDETKATVNATESAEAYA